MSYLRTISFRNVSPTCYLLSRDYVCPHCTRTVPGSVSLFFEKSSKQRDPSRSVPTPTENHGVPIPRSCQIFFPKITGSDLPSQSPSTVVTSTTRPPMLSSTLDVSHSVGVRQVQDPLHPYCRRKDGIDRRLGTGRPRLRRVSPVRP